MSSYYGFFYLKSGIFLQNLHPLDLEGVAVLLACQRCEFLCELKRVQSLCFRAVKRILFAFCFVLFCFVSFLFFNVWRSPCQNYLDSIAAFAVDPHVFVFISAGCIETDSLCAAPFCVSLYTRERAAGI